MRALHFIHNKILPIHRFHENVAAVELIDLFIKQFIIHCPDRLQEMFNICEEELCCIEEMDPSYVAIDQIDKYPLHFKFLLNLITRLYEGQTSQLTNLARQFFTSEYVGFPRFPRL